MRLYWYPDQPMGPYMSFVRQTVLPHLPRAEDIGDCDAIVFPHDVTPRGSPASLVRLRAAAYRARRARKPLLVFARVDTTAPLAVPGTIVLRTSMKRSVPRPGEHLLPYVWEGWDHQVEWVRRERADEPTIGFCGWATRKRSGWLRQLDSELTCNFVLRDKFWAGSPLDPDATRAFFRNVMETDLTFAMRGRGNFSMRFYQTLSCGRIPLWVDSDSVLPYDGLEPIPWERISVRVPAAAPEACRPSVMKFWDEISDYSALQDEIRALYLRYFTPEGLAAHLLRHADFYLHHTA